MNRIWHIAVALLFVASDAAVAAEWPREIRSGGQTVIVYEPQADSLQGQDLRARMAVALRRAGATEPEFGALWVVATLQADRDDTPATIRRLRVERTRFPDASDQDIRELTALIEGAAPGWDLGISPADLRAGLNADGGVTDPGFRNDPPAIIVRKGPAILVTLDGAPELRPIPETRYQRVVNTAFPIVYDPSARNYWLYGSDLWFTTRQLVGGAWSARDTAPAGIAALFAGTEQQSPLDAAAGVSADQLRRAEIIVVTEPTELIAVDGEPQFSPLVGDDMLYVTNTDSDLFLEVPTGQYYVVLSGRWYRSRSLGGPWAWVDPATVPPAFAAVPAQSDKADVRAYVPGTEQADDALLDAMIPQTSTVRRGAAPLEVTYDGTPVFDQIPGTALSWARNSPAQVLRYQDRYYVVDQGIWYVSPSAYGPWEVATSRPGDLERIPASSPVYNVRYVHIYDYTPEVVYVGYLPGYLWAFPYRGTVVYGTGYRYRPWVGPVAYYPSPWTWGFSARYDPWSGWGFGMSWTAGWSSLSYAWGPAWGYWAPSYPLPYRGGYRAGYRHGYWDGSHTGGWFGPGGYRPPRHDPYRHDRDRGRRVGIRPPDRRHIDRAPRYGDARPTRPLPGNNLYRRPGNPAPVAGRSGSRWTDSARPDARRQDERRGDARWSASGRGDARRPEAGRPSNDVFVDRQGNPWRRTPDGWQSREQQRWRAAPTVNEGSAGLNRRGNSPEAGRNVEARRQPGSERGNTARRPPVADDRVETRREAPVAQRAPDRPAWQSGQAQRYREQATGRRDRRAPPEAGRAPADNRPLVAAENRRAVPPPAVYRAPREAEAPRWSVPPQSQPRPQPRVEAPVRIEEPQRRAEPPAQGDGRSAQPAPERGGRYGEGVRSGPEPRPSRENRSWGRESGRRDRR